MDDALNGALNI